MSTSSHSLGTRRRLRVILLTIAACFAFLYLYTPPASLFYARTGQPLVLHSGSRGPDVSTTALADQHQLGKKQRAKTLTPKDLLARHVPGNHGTGGIPKLFHQSWKTNVLPAKFEKWSDSCRDRHPDWEWILWSDEDNLELIQTRYPWLEETFEQLPGNIYRVDLMRNLYMHAFGGVYADLDTECLRSTATMLEAYNISTVSDEGEAQEQAARAQHPVAVFGQMGNDSTFEHHIPNAWMASTPGHAFFQLPLQSARAELEHSRAWPQRMWYEWPSAEEMTGPVALRRGILKYARLPGATEEVLLLPSDWVYPFNWNTDESTRAICSAEQDTFDEDECRALLGVEEKGSISISYWSHTHRGKGTDEKNIAKLGG